MTDWRFLSLFFVQFVGVGVSLVQAMKLQKFCSIDNTLNKRMEQVLWGLVVLSALVAITNRDLAPVVLQGFGVTGQLPRFFRIMSLSHAVPIYALADLCVLAFLIYSTGGSRLSSYSPFLYIIVPITIILRESPVRVAIYFSLTLVIFCAMLKWRYAAFTISNETSYDRWWGGISALSVSFPTFVFLLAGSADPTS